MHFRQGQGDGASWAAVAEAAGRTWTGLKLAGGGVGRLLGTGEGGPCHGPEGAIDEPLLAPPVLPLLAPSLSDVSAPPVSSTA